MRSYTHIAGAVVLFLSFAFLTNLNPILTGAFFAGLAALFPDLIDRIIGEHRGYGHSILLLIPGIIIGFANFTIGSALVIGIISHSLLDMITTHGTPLLYPLSKTNFVVLVKKRRVKTGTNHDKAVFIALMCLLFPMLFFTLKSMYLIPNSLSNGFGGVDVPADKFTDINTSDGIKTNFNFQIQLNQNTNKIISINRVNENETTVLIKNIDPGS